MPSNGWMDRKRFSMKMQEIAIQKVYHSVWPNFRILEIDKLDHELARLVDIGGADKLLFAKDGHNIFLAQRFRKSSQGERYRDFTLREKEYLRHSVAMRDGGFIPGYYVYGWANQSETDFTELKIINYQMWLNDVLGGMARMWFKETKNEWQENFYYVPFSNIPLRYITFAYPCNGHQKLAA